MTRLLASCLIAFGAITIGTQLGHADKLDENTQILMAMVRVIAGNEGCSPAKPEVLEVLIDRLKVNGITLNDQRVGEIRDHSHQYLLSMISDGTLPVFCTRYNTIMQSDGRSW